MHSSSLGRGIGLSVLASTLFAFLSGYTRLLSPLDGTDIFAWRILWTTLAILALLWWQSRLPQLRAAWRIILDAPYGLGRLLLMAALLGVQQWIFLWASVNEMALDISLGYFLLPLVMVMVGRMCYGERLDGFQRLAVACALVGVVHELWMTRAFSWPTLVVALGYPPYFMLRRRFAIDSVLLFAIELLMILPFSLLWLAASPLSTDILRMPSMYLLLPVLGVTSMAALSSYLKASRMLPMGLFGILGYVEPVLLVLVAIVALGEQMTVTQLGTYVPIWLSVVFTGFHSARLMRARRSSISPEH